MSKKRRALGRGIGRGLEAAIPNPETAQPKDEGASMVEALKVDPRITVYSQKGARVLSYLKNTVPNFSKSQVAREILEEAIKARWPEIWARLEKDVIN